MDKCLEFNKHVGKDGATLSEDDVISMHHRLLTWSCACRYQLDRVHGQQRPAIGQLARDAVQAC